MARFLGEQNLFKASKETGHYTFFVDTLNKHVSGSHSAGSDFVQIQTQTLFEPALETNVCFDRDKLTLIVLSQA